MDRGCQLAAAGTGVLRQPGAHALPVVDAVACLAPRLRGILSGGQTMVMENLLHPLAGEKSSPIAAKCHRSASAPP
ncbi:hypothetical protein BH18ACT8_BH18ACT8_10570 [soil metagenome]